MASGGDDDMMTPGFFFFLIGGEAERGLCINRKSTLNIPIVFIMQTAVNKLKKNLADGTTPKIVRKHDCRGHRFETVELLSTVCRNMW